MAGVASRRVETSTIGYLCHATSFITLALTMVALFSAEISPIYLERNGDTFHHDFDAAVWILGTAWILELFTLVSGLFTPDVEEEANSAELSDSFLMFVVYSVLGCFYKIMASKNSLGIIHTDTFAGNRPVYTLRYVEWSIAVPILMLLSGRSVPLKVKGKGQEAAHDCGTENPHASLLPAIILTVVYIYASLLALITTSSTWRIVLILVSFFGYGVASLDQIIGWCGGRAVDSAAPTALSSRVLVAMQVLLFGGYGAVFLLACFELISPALEQALYTFGDVSAKVGHSALLVAMRRQQQVRAVQEARRAAVESSANYARLVDKANAPIVACDLRGRLEIWNRKVAALTGMPAERMLGKPLLDFVDPDCRFHVEALVAACRRGDADSDHFDQPFQLDLLIEDKSQRRGRRGDREEKERKEDDDDDDDGDGDDGDGDDGDGEENERRVPMLMAATGVRDHGTGAIVRMVAVGQDLTEVIKFKAVEERKNRFMAVVSHELRSPLHGITGLVTSLIAAAEADAEKEEQRTIPESGRASCVGAAGVRAVATSRESSAAGSSGRDSFIKPLKMIKSCSERLLQLVITIMDMSAMAAENRAAAAAATSGKGQGQMVRRKALKRERVDLVAIVEEVCVLVGSATSKTMEPLLGKDVELLNGVVAPDSPQSWNENRSQMRENTGCDEANCRHSGLVIEGDSHAITQVLFNLITNACKFCRRGTIQVTVRRRIAKGNQKTGQGRRLQNKDNKGMSTQGDRVEIDVKDTGIGISRRSLKRIFEPFEQEVNADSRSFEGIGLGLAVSREVVRRHGGDIRVRSVVGRGSTFTVSLPTRLPDTLRTVSSFAVLPHRSSKDNNDDDDEDEADEEGVHDEEDEEEEGSVSEYHEDDDVGVKVRETSAQPSVAQRTKAVVVSPFLTGSTAAVEGKKDLRRGHPSMIAPSALSQKSSPVKMKPLLLSVDDDAVNQEVVKRALQGEDYDVVQAMNGFECLDFFRKNPTRLPDAVLLDVMMPGLDGFEVCSQLRSPEGPFSLGPSELPIIMLSAREPVPSSIIQGLLSGSNDYMAKPFDIPVLKARVRSVLEMKRLHEMELRSAAHTNLLHEILPPHICARLVSGETVVSESLGDVSILFSDIVGWTEMAESLPTAGIVRLLNHLFSAFDELIERHAGVFKVETIGDAYMVAAGHDGQRHHAAALLQFGLAMIQAASKVPKSLLPPRMQLRIRVGIHTGGAYAGVVGKKVPRYCFFGDSVNVSSRMESHGEPGCVHFSAATRDALLESRRLFYAEPTFNVRNGTMAGSLEEKNCNTGKLQDFLEGISNLAAALDNGNGSNKVQEPEVENRRSQGTIIARGKTPIKGKGVMETFLCVPAGTPIPKPPKHQQQQPQSIPLQPKLSPALTEGADPPSTRLMSSPSSCMVREEESFASISMTTGNDRSDFEGTSTANHFTASRTSMKPARSSNSIQSFASSLENSARPLLSLERAELVVMRRAVEKARRALLAKESELDEKEVQLQFVLATAAAAGIFLDFNTEHSGNSVEADQDEASKATGRGSRSAAVGVVMTTSPVSRSSPGYGI